jgi:cellulose biosynthesis protein BcsQ
MFVDKESTGKSRNSVVVVDLDPQGSETFCDSGTRYYGSGTGLNLNKNHQKIYNLKTMTLRTHKCNIFF